MSERNCEETLPGPQLADVLPDHLAKFEQFLPETDEYKPEPHEFAREFLLQLNEDFAAATEELDERFVNPMADAFLRALEQRSFVGVKVVVEHLEYIALFRQIAGFTDEDFDFDPSRYSEWHLVQLPGLLANLARPIFEEHKTASKKKIVPAEAESSVIGPSGIAADDARWMIRYAKRFDRAFAQATHSEYSERMLTASILLSPEDEQRLGPYLLSGYAAELRKELNVLPEPGDDERLANAHQARAIMILANVRWAASRVSLFLPDRKTVERYTGRFNEEDALNAATEGLRYAARKFDYRKGNKFSTYATQWIDQSLQRLLNTNASSLYVAEGPAAEAGRLLRTDDDPGTMDSQRLHDAYAVMSTHTVRLDAHMDGDDSKQTMHEMIASTWSDEDRFDDASEAYQICLRIKAMIEEAYPVHADVLWDYFTHKHGIMGADQMSDAEMIAAGKYTDRSQITLISDRIARIVARAKDREGELFNQVQ